MQIIESVYSTIESAVNTRASATAQWWIGNAFALIAALIALATILGISYYA